MTAGGAASGRSVSVVVPCYNYARYLRGCIDSVLGQADVDVRVLILDDASTDDSRRIADELAAADPRVEVRSHAVNHGHISTYNEGMQWASGSYTLLLDPDDLLTPGALQRVCDLMEAHPEVGMVYGRPLVFRDDGPPPHATDGPCRWAIWPGRDWFELRCRAAANCIYAPEVVVRTALLHQLGGFHAELPHTADFELWMRVALYADVGFIEGPPQAGYRDHPLGMHHQQFASELGDLSQIRAAFDLLFRNHGHVLADRSRLEDLARRSLARRALQAACRAYDRGERDQASPDGLERLALATCPGARASAEMRALRWRKVLGPRLSRIVHSPVSSAVRRVRRGLRW
jgi:hypothetical protein